MLNRFGFAARSHMHISEYQIWTHYNNAIELITQDFTCHKLEHIHENLLRAEWVEKAVDWLYSIQLNYLVLPRLIEMDVMNI